MITRVRRLKISVQWLIIISVGLLELYLVLLFFFGRFRPIKLIRSLLQSASGLTEFLGKLCSRSRPQHARFFTCLCETGVRGHFKLKLFCYPQRLYYDVIRKISECVVPYKVEGCSSKPVCGEEKILVSLSEAIIPQGTDQKNALQFVRYNIIQFISGPSSTYDLIKYF